MKKAYFLFMIILAAFLFSYQTSLCQTNNKRIIWGRKDAEKELNIALSKDPGVNIVDNNSILIKDSATVVQMAEPLLFKIYGKENIIKERPYNVYLIKNYWVITGRLPFKIGVVRVGGVFLIIFDSRNGKIIEIIHGK